MARCLISYICSNDTEIFSLRNVIYFYFFKLSSYLGFELV